MNLDKRRSVAEPKKTTSAVKKSAAARLGAATQSEAHPRTDAKTHGRAHARPEAVVEAFRPAHAGPRPAAVARSTLMEALFHDVGRAGSLLEHPKGNSFTLQPGLPEGAVHSNRTVQVPMPNGASVPHTVDIAVELEPGPVVHVDILDGQSTLAELKAAAFDVQHFKKRHGGLHCILVHVRSPHALLSREALDAVAHPYDYAFGVDEADVHLGSKFAACRAEVLKRIRGGA